MKKEICILVQLPTSISIRSHSGGLSYSKKLSLYPLVHMLCSNECSLFSHCDSKFFLSNMGLPCEMESTLEFTLKGTDVTLILLPTL